MAFLPCGICTQLCTTLYTLTYTLHLYSDKLLNCLRYVRVVTVELLLFFIINITSFVKKKSAFCNVHRLSNVPIVDNIFMSIIQVCFKLFGSLLAVVIICF